MLKLTQRDNMKFKQLREANLSKAQINKVHDKADDLPKSDFIKRYGKEGDAVRFATATNIVKKQLGLDEYVMNVDIATGKPFPKVPPAGTDGGNRNPYTSGRAAAKAGKKYSSNPHKVAAKKLFWSKGYVDYKKNPGSYKEELDKEDEKSIGDVIKGLKKAVKSHQGQVKSLTKDIKDEVKLDEVHFSNKGEPPAPKGMHKLRSGRDIPSSPQVDKIHKKVVKMTDRNDHFGAKIEIAKACGDKKLVQIYNALELMHDKYGVVGNKSIELRQIFEPVLNNAIDRKFGKYADVIRDAT